MQVLPSSKIKWISQGSVRRSPVDSSHFCGLTSHPLAFTYLKPAPWHSHSHSPLLHFSLTCAGRGGIVALPLIALPLVVTVGSNLIQITGKRLLGRKIFRIAPLHHHFEALGWPPYKVTMRYWIVSVVAAI